MGWFQLRASPKVTVMRLAGAGGSSAKLSPHQREALAPCHVNLSRHRSTQDRTAGFSQSKGSKRERENKQETVLQLRGEKIPGQKT